MLWLPFGAIACLIAPTLVHGRSISGSHVLHEERDAGRSQLTKRDRLHSETPLVMKIALKQQNMHQADHWLKEISAPTSPNFAKFWTPEEVIEAFQPPAESVNAVLLWLESAGVPRHKVAHSENKQWLVFGATADIAEALFHTDYHEFHDLEGRSLVGTDRIHLPRHLTDSIDFVKPGVVMQPMPASHRERRRAATKPFSRKTKLAYSENERKSAENVTGCAKEITADCISTLLNFPFPDLTYTATTTQSSFGTFQKGDYYQQPDLDLYWNEFFPERIPNGTGPNFVSIDGGLLVSELKDWNPGASYGAEPASNLEQTIPFYFPNKVTVIQQDDEYYAFDHDPGLLNPMLDAIDGSYCTSCSNGICGNDPTLDPIYPDINPPLPEATGWTRWEKPYQCGTFKPPPIISSSYYSILGKDDEHTQAYSLRQCAEIMKLSLQGVTFIWASGDEGVGYTDGTACRRGRFSYEHPNGCPYILMVGGTMIEAGKTEHDPEVVWQAGPAGTQPWADYISSGSGFSNFHERPSYQKAVVDAYLEKHDPGYPYYRGANLDNATMGYYNRDGRAYPDISANAGPIPRWLDRKRAQDGGTSASVQLVGIMLARIVDERRKAGKPNPALGFVHEVLYAHPEVFNDVVSGNNPGCGGPGFQAAPGWDAPTGLGVPDYQKLLKLYLSLP
ncbi:protease s8 tripeptidyl peptidase like protein [Zymoseptoria brevis]|uniref:Protease s8 tripeptidyl peptidase like protein n=1 Tax=Zymoseptoria brevis TaxID=1047168 RepID=A0A0F4GVB7_9PEZI|nr:protease s8 tripeptidyl peptidase like protein [Zymoseptoria brevis]